MIAVGSQLLQMSPQGALVVVLAHGLVLFVFSSPHLADLLRSFNLTPLPLVPLSSSQAVVGAIMGISCLRGRRGSLNLSYLGRICLSWLISPVVSGLLSFVLLFVFQNVFLMKVHTDKEYEVSSRSLDRLEAGGISHERLPSSGVFTSEADLAQAIADRGSLSRSEFKQVCDETQVINLTLDEMSSFIRRVSGWFTLEEIKALAALSGQSFHYKWEFREAIEAQQITLSVSKEHFIFQNFSHLPKNQ